MRQKGSGCQRAGGVVSGRRTKSAAVIPAPTWLSKNSMPRLLENQRKACITRGFVVGVISPFHQ